MLPTVLRLLCLAALGARAQDTSSTSRTDTSSSADETSMATYTYSLLSFTNSYSIITTDIPEPAFTGSDYTYVQVTGQTTVSDATSTGTAGTAGNATMTTSSGNSQITYSSRSVSLTVIGGITTTMSGNATNQTASSTTSSAAPTNTVPCNGYPEFCNRKYSNITFVTSHNAAFVVPNNAASNQELPIRDQLNDGVRMLSGEVQWENNTLWNCHTSCELLNAGTWQSELEVVRDWLQANPYDVLTILIVNSDFTDVENFVAPITNAGLLPYVYEPTYVPQYRDQWPTLGEMIIRNQRLVFMMDYDADQTRVPYILDEFTHMWETPFSPQDPAFPCTIQRPPNSNETMLRENFMYMANHNLNVAIDLSSIGIDTNGVLIPDTANINTTNGQYNMYGQLGAMNENCTGMWDRPPNFLLVDYYNRGDPEPGSVFHVAAAANGVTYTKACCGVDQSSSTVVRASSSALAGVLIFAAFALW